MMKPNDIEKVTMGSYKFVIDQVDTHVHLRMFINGAQAGKLCLRFEEYSIFWDMLQFARVMSNDKWDIKFEDEMFWKEYKRR